MKNWEAIVSEHGPVVWATLWRLLADRADVEDCFQETFLGALQILRKNEIKSWPALLCHLATARAMDRLRKRYREQSIGTFVTAADGCSQERPEEVASREVGPVEEAMAAEVSERLREALTRLPERQAEIFYLHELCGWSRREVGERMKMSENAVGVTIRRARQQLQSMLVGVR